MIITIELYTVELNSYLTYILTKTYTNEYIFNI